MVSPFSTSWFAILVLIISTSTGCSRGDKQEKQNLPPLRTLKTLFGKTPESKEIALVRKQLKGEPEVTRSGGDLYYSWKGHGLEILFEKGTVKGIFFYADGADEFKQYRGELPDGLHFSDSRRDAEKKLGEPKAKGGGGVIPFWVTYPKKGVSITYVSPDIKDQANKIHHIAILAVQDK